MYGRNTKKLYPLCCKCTGIARMDLKQHAGDNVYVFENQAEIFMDIFKISFFK